MKLYEPFVYFKYAVIIGVLAIVPDEPQAVAAIFLGGFALLLEITNRLDGPT